MLRNRTITIIPNHRCQTRARGGGIAPLTGLQPPPSTPRVRIVFLLSAIRIRRYSILFQIDFVVALEFICIRPYLPIDAAYFMNHLLSTAGNDNIPSRIYNFTLKKITSIYVFFTVLKIADHVLIFFYHLSFFL